MIWLVNCLYRVGLRALKSQFCLNTEQLMNKLHGNEVLDLALVSRLHVRLYQHQTWTESKIQFYYAWFDTKVSQPNC